jgi:hypothetical protein
MQTHQNAIIPALVADEVNHAYDDDHELTRNKDINTMTRILDNGRHFFLLSRGVDNSCCRTFEGSNRVGIVSANDILVGIIYCRVTSRSRFGRSPRSMCSVRSSPFRAKLPGWRLSDVHRTKDHVRRHFSSNKIMLSVAKNKAATAAISTITGFAIMVAVSVTHFEWSN